jgi:putative (di)nucleoside polyphosphate hydrolase
MQTNDPASLPYRPCAGIMLLNREGKVFVGQRIDNSLEAWQMPQGGIDEGEDAETAAIREIGEETGIAAHLVEIVAQSKEDLFYDLPTDLIGKVWKGRYRGQRQAWFLMRFLGEDSDIDIVTEHPEFRAWRWSDPADLPAMIVPFKRVLYEQVVALFSTHLERIRA